MSSHLNQEKQDHLFVSCADDLFTRMNIYAMSGRKRQNVILNLALALQYAQHANFAGTARQAVADGYSAIDAAMSAILTQEGIEPPRNHKRKLALVRTSHPAMLSPNFKWRGTSATYSPGGDWDSVEGFYKQWLDSRYRSFDLPPAQASGRVREAHQFINATMRVIARRMKIGARKLGEQASKQAFGTDHSELGLAVGTMHDHLFSEAERFGEMYGSKLGTKLASTTNYCELDIATGDQLTQAIIGEDEEIAAEGARVYAEFNKLVERIIEKRRERILGSRQGEAANAEALNDSPNFMLSMKARYHGATVRESGERWARTLAGLGVAFRKPPRSRKENQRGRKS
ncbi:hypothetical protein [Propylenella binzhouense]|uniref:Uncharacterized protein n=1 Tax=Propylenella binzhouense TaxID=2555902 RepID=A0A964T7C4_9HYPH|nr:hypothetical protein [Propylenella binzhouense]MYZ48732.1 hypothetical protein [Propylenella binzhouense]